MDGWTVPGYTTIETLGEGAHGRVVAAERDRDGRRVAVKYLSDPARRAAFATEARHLSRVRSRHVVRLLDHVEHGDGAALVMDHAPGTTLKSLLAETGPLAPQAALLVFRGALRALEATHRAGIVHRDLKPGNLLVGPRGEVTLIDYGIAVATGTETTPIGTPAYMPPEQWQALPATPSWDLYAATAVFFECLTGARPYPARYIAELAAQHLYSPVPDADDARLQPLIAAGLAKDPEDRACSAAALVRAVDHLARRAYGLTWTRRARPHFLPATPAFVLAA
ncbi:serine/threonine-protein kinase [Actinocorallia sp. A-T 12471]|uniref:serine/threonine-protein kinase n=1 Tax=Actinocorallia sp. A-T 12471 TaxID=3089813 RepID=UPI0029CCA4C5|nr:serine/threonine-protein kinase [Actinocorallia sp. A-T 12471]MDX6738734.1 serine/threonine-protein kinase [Actinocorallia sp. A-T 12471]